MAKPTPVTMEFLVEHIRNKNFETEEELQNYLSSIIGKSMDEIIKNDNSPKMKALQLIEKAKAERSDKKCLKYINEALALDPDNADAYLMLANLADDEANYLTLVEKAVDAGKRAIGDEFDALKGEFWANAQTRPYMRAVARKADILRGNDRVDEAIVLYQSLIKLNPNDNQGIRDLLAPLLILTNRKSEYKKLQKKFLEDESLSFYICDAFLAWEEAPKSPHTADAFKDMFMRNAFLAEVLFDASNLEPELPEAYQIGSPEEALFSIYTCGFLFATIDEKLSKLIIKVIQPIADDIDLLQEKWFQYQLDDTKIKFLVSTVH
ncbi:MAG: tetratricopeptide repeat protein [Bacteroidota bacterium]